MRRDPQRYLWDMRQAILDIQTILGSCTLDEFLGDKRTRLAVERLLSILSEAMYQMQHHFPERAREIPEHMNIIRFRHVIVHGYADLKYGRIWDIIQNDLPKLLRYLEATIEPLDSPLS